MLGFALTTILEDLLMSFYLKQLASTPTHGGESDRLIDWPLRRLQMSGSLTLAVSPSIGRMHRGQAYTQCHYYYILLYCVVLYFIHTFIYGMHSQWWYTLQNCVHMFDTIWMSHALYLKLDSMTLQDLEMSHVRRHQSQSLNLLWTCWRLTN